MKKLISYSSFVNESKLQDNYREFFSKMLEIYGVKSPAEFKNSKETSQKFYDDIKKGWNNGEGISKYGQDILDKFEKEKNIKESVEDLIDEPIIESTDEPIQEEFKLTDDEIKGAKKIESPEYMYNRYKLKDGRIIDVGPRGDMILVIDKDEEYEPIKLTDDEVKGAKKIESPEYMYNRYKLKDGRIIDVGPTGYTRLVIIKNKVQESTDEPIVEKLDGEELLSAKQKKLPEGLKKAIIKKIKKSGKIKESLDDQYANRIVNDVTEIAMKIYPELKNKNKNIVKDIINSNVYGEIIRSDFEESDLINHILTFIEFNLDDLIEEIEEAEEYKFNESLDGEELLSDKQKKLPDGLKKAIIKKLKKSGKKDDDKDEKEESVKESTDNEKNKYTLPSEKWDDSISKFLEVSNNFSNLDIDIIHSNVIKVNCDDNSMIDDLMAEFEQINPEYICEYDSKECTITINEK